MSVVVDNEKNNSGVGTPVRYDVTDILILVGNIFPTNTISYWVVLERLHLFQYPIG